MDRFTRNYSIFLGIVAIAVLAWVLYEDPIVAEINQALAKDPLVAAYPYTFKVQRLHNGVAVVSSPRSVDFPVYRALGILYPKLAGLPQDDPALMAAQAQLAEVQKRVQQQVSDHQGVSSVSWELDRNWLAANGVQLTP